MRILFVLTLAILSRQAFAADQLILQCAADSKTRTALPFEVWKYDKTDEKWGKYPPLNDYYVKIIGG